jgi:DNA polymerase III sliding clamp (beta) subunit (PCNA family)
MAERPHIKMVVDRKNLLDTVKTASKFADHPKTQMPILACIELQFSENTLRVQATDLDHGYTRILSGKTTFVGEPGDDLCVYIDKKKLVDAISTIDTASVPLEAYPSITYQEKCPSCGAEEFRENPKDGIELQTNLEWNQVQCVKCGHISIKDAFSPPSLGAILKVGGYFELVSYYGETDYPGWEYPEEMEGIISTSSAKLKTLLPAMGNDDDGFNLHCVYFDHEHNLMVATDGHRLHSVPCETSRTFVLPGDTLKKMAPSCKEFTVFFEEKESPEVEEGLLDGLKKNQLVALYEDYIQSPAYPPMPGTYRLADMKEEILKHINAAIEHENMAKFAYVVAGDFRLKVSLPDVNFPDYWSILKGKEDSHPEVTVKNKTLREAFTQSLALATKDFNAVKVAFNGCIDIEMDTKEGHRYARASVPIESGGVEPPVSGGFNARYFMEILEMFKGKDETVSIQVPLAESGSMNRPLFISTGEFNGLIMPIRI